MAHAGHGHVDDAGVEGCDGVVADVPAVEDADGEVVDDDVGAEGHLAGGLAGVGAGEVELEQALVAVPHGEVGMVGPAGGDGAGVGGDFDDVGAHVGEEACAEGPGEDVGEVEDADAGEGAHGVLLVVPAGGGEDVGGADGF